MVKLNHLSKTLGVCSALLAMGYNSSALAQYSTDGLTVTLDNNSWLQVQPMDSSSDLVGCQASQTCTVSAEGLYRIIDFGPDPDDRFDNVLLSADASTTCAAPVIGDTTADFTSGGNGCYYKMQTTGEVIARTTSGADCEGTGTQLGSCVLESNTGYLIDRWVLSPWGNGGTQISIAAEPRGDTDTDTGTPDTPGGTGLSIAEIRAIHENLPRKRIGGQVLH